MSIHEKTAVYKIEFNSLYLYEICYIYYLIVDPFRSEKINYVFVCMYVCIRYLCNW